MIGAGGLAGLGEGEEVGYCCQREVFLVGEVGCGGLGRAEEGLEELDGAGAHEGVGGPGGVDDLGEHAFERVV